MTPHDTPREFMAAHTEAFVVAAFERVAPSRALRVLEVGAGDGRLAVRLARRGHDVTAVEMDARRAGMARKRGARVVEADFVAADEGALPAARAFDAVLFTRVLHHLHPLELALDRAAARLAPGGIVVGEEFAWERIEPAALAWLAETRAGAERAGLLPAEPDPPRETLESWRRYHSETHRLHTGAEMLRAVAERLVEPSVDSAPYLYRYLCTRLVDSPEAGAFAAAAFERERAAIAAGAFPALACRFVARARP